ncbi:MAG: carboxypeptidase-like regulatory domain-containing protein [Planctomycetaceae bacterium]|nr:carboxypeptidase-like regulatory domain-containing protein [Planctomycetaceae bacterium]
MRKCFFVLVFMTLLTGCAKQSPYDTEFVSGKVLVDGEPMQGISIIFSPVHPNEGHAAGGITDAKGQYKLSTAGLDIGSGAVAGTYNVTFRKIEIVGNDLSMEEAEEKYPNGLPVIYHVPKKYENPKTAGIEPVLVEKKKKNVFDFNLSTKN